MMGGAGGDVSCRAGFGSAVINPEPGLSLAGYFNPRPNTGVLDDLHVKVMLLEANGTLTGIISFDLCVISERLLGSVRDALRREGFPFAETIPLVATHTHTGPDIGDTLTAEPPAPDYIERVARVTVEAVRAAREDLAPSELRAGGVQENPYAFNRRYWMKDGRVVTNPGKLNPDIVKPEGPVDREIGVLAAYRDGRPVGILANITNHTDTIGGDKVSADWPGHMERALRRALCTDVSVITLIGPSGNINHFDVTRSEAQTSCAEARRIGEGYGEIVRRALDGLEPIRPAPLRLLTRRVRIPYRRVSDEELAEARRIVATAAREATGDLTSEDLARGSEVVKRFFAEQLIAYAEWTKGRDGRDFDLAAMEFSDDLAMVFLPGEPFTEIGMAIKRASPFRRTFVVELANGECGYVPLKECFERGGYEILPVVGGGPREDTCDILVAAATALVRGER